MSKTKIFFRTFFSRSKKSRNQVAENTNHSHSSSVYFAHDPSEGSSSPLVILPSKSFLERIYNANELWMNHDSLSFSFKQNPKLKVHCFPSSLLNVPKLYTLPFSTKQRYRFPSAIKMDSFLTKLEEQFQLLDNHEGTGNPQLSLLVNESTNRGTWLLESYAPLFDPFFQQKEDDHVNAIGVKLFLPNKPNAPIPEYLSECMSYNQGIELAHQEIGSPDEWIRVMNTTGLIPSWDLISALESSQQFFLTRQEDPALAPTAPELNAIEFVGRSDDEILQEQIHSSADDVKRESEYQAIQEALANEQHRRNNSSDVTSPFAKELISSLSKFYEERLGPISPEIQKIRTGSLLADGIIQKLVLTPDDWIEYNRILESHFESLAAHLESSNTETVELQDLNSLHQFVRHQTKQDLEIQHLVKRVASFVKEEDVSQKNRSQAPADHHILVFYDISLHHLFIKELESLNLFQ